MAKKKKKGNVLPKNAKVGSTHTIKRKGREITMKKVPKFGKNKNLSWKIIKNKPA
ncbi:MAG: hypothetical protein ACFFDN_00150 [Candidatus Hodarchaeota archaeon]